uniref:hypothetical protein n=1 Tax=Trichocoleus desertorum TaxID=1481672 RepID=UPI0025B5CB6F|nr:hypothetical protein [Trichocoleus desertorum]
MRTNLGFVVKVMVISALIAIAIKYAASLSAIPTMPKNVLVLFVVLLPTVALAMALGWRAWQQRSLS